MLNKSLPIIFLFCFFLYAFTQSDKPKSDSTAIYKRSLADCKTAADSLAWYKANVQVNLALAKIRNDTMIKRLLADSVVIIDTTKIK